jgi:hypothetical protein
VTCQREDLLDGARVPQPNDTVEAGTRHHVPARTPRHTENAAAATLEHRDRPAVVRVPQSNCCVESTGGHDLGGVGKSRLALELAWTCRDALADGAVFLDLAPVRSAEALSDSVARTFGLPERSPPFTGQDVISHLRDKNVLAVLDNLEQPLSTAPFLASVLTACPRISVVVSSRGILHLRGEELPAISRQATRRCSAA